MKTLIRFAVGLTCFALVLTIALAASVWAQQPVLTQPYPTTSTNASGTVATTNTFQAVFAAPTTSRGRAGCLIQNLSSASIFVFFGTLASATTPTSVQLGQRETVSCNLGGTTLQDAISVTGAANIQFFAIQQ